MRLFDAFRRTDRSDRQASDPTPPWPALEDQDVEVLIGLCETAMEEEPYTNRAVYLCGLIDRLESWLLAR